MIDLIEPFRLDIDEGVIGDLRQRLAMTRWPDRQVVGDWSQGVPLGDVQALCDYWRVDYDWRRCEAALNRLGQHKTRIDGLDIHFLHIRSPEPGAMPMIMTHGWPGSIIEFLKVVGPLTDPVAHGGDARDAFHLILPSLPGFGFSGHPTEPGWGVERTAKAWIELMSRLGYSRFVAQGGDWGSVVTTQIALARPAGCLAIHLSLAISPPDEAQIADATNKEQAALADMAHYIAEESGYQWIQRTRPQTIGYGLADSPAAQAAWIYEKYHNWVDHAGDVESVLKRDEMLDNIMLYWLSNAGASSARLYWESAASAWIPQQVDFPVAFSIFPKELFRSSRRWAERLFPNIIYWNETARGGHFAAFEQPALFVGEVRNAFRSVR